MRLLMLLAIGLVAGCGTSTVTTFNVTTAKVGETAPVPTAVKLTDDAAKALIIADVKKSLNDTDGFEVVDWAGPILYDPSNADAGVYWHLKYRAKNAVGAKVISTIRYSFDKDGKVTQTASGRPWPN